MNNIEVVDSTRYPQTLVYIALRACKHPHLNWRREYEKAKEKGDSKAGELAIELLLGMKGQRGHYGCFEHPSISLYCDNVPSPTLNQARTHRVGHTFDALSMRDGKLEDAQKVIAGEMSILDFFHVPDEQVMTEYYREALKMYIQIHHTHGSEQARDVLPASYLTSFLWTANARSLMHFLDLRLKNNAQDLIIDFSEKVMPHFLEWMPEIADWYLRVRAGKAILAP